MSITAADFKQSEHTTHHSRRANWLREASGGEAASVIGGIKTDYGIVMAHSSKASASTSFTQMEMVRKGHTYIRTWQRDFSKGYLVTLARNFAADIFEQADE